MSGRLWQMAIVGWPVERSLSPALWEGMGARRELAVEYGLCPVRPDDEASWDALWASELDGFNVTAPWKERAAARCDWLSPAATRIGAVNTVLRRDPAWEGHMTDGYGFVRSLLAIEEPLRGRSLAVLGTGGAGRAVARAAADAGARVTLVSRTPARSPTGCEDLERIGWGVLGERGRFDIVANATPIGGEDDPPPVPDGAWGPGTLAVDLHYRPAATSFLRAARAVGARTLNGLGMLIYQACLAAALLFDGDPSAAESYEEDFESAAREAAA